MLWQQELSENFQVQLIKVTSETSQNEKKLILVGNTIDGGKFASYVTLNLLNGEYFDSEINVVLGDEWNAGNLSYHLKSRPVWEGIVEREKLDQLKDYMCLDSVCVGSR